VCKRPVLTIELAPITGRPERRITTQEALASLMKYQPAKEAITREAVTVALTKAGFLV